MEQSPSWKANWFLQLVKKFPVFLEPEGSSPYPQVPATCPYPEPTPPSPHNSLQLQLYDTHCFNKSILSFGSNDVYISVKQF